MDASELDGDNVNDDEDGANSAPDVQVDDSAVIEMIVERVQAALDMIAHVHLSEADYTALKVVTRPIEAAKAGVISKIKEMITGQAGPHLETKCASALEVLNKAKAKLAAKIAQLGGERATPRSRGSNSKCKPRRRR